MTRVIEPTKGRVLVKLGASNYGDIPVPPKDYDSITYGLIIKVNELDKEQCGEWLNKIGYWRQYKDDMKVEVTEGGESLALIDINDVMGISHEE